MSRRTVPGTIDEMGRFLPLPKPKPLPDPAMSLDEIGKRIITALDRAVVHLSSKIVDGVVDRDVVGALKDCQSMLRDLKKDEKDFLESLSDEELENLVKRKMSST